MKNILIILPLLLVGCTISQKIVYNTEDISVPQGTPFIPIMVELRVLEDNRANIEENALLFESSRQAFVNEKRLCINSERHYTRDTVVTQITKLMVEHFMKARLFGMTFYNNSMYSKYYMTGRLNSFYGEQEFSRGAAIGAQFGLIGALATAGIKTQGRIEIEISDLKLYRKEDGELIMDFGSFFKEYKDDFRADADCWAIYSNTNEMLKDFNSHLIEKIRNDLSTLEFEP